MREPGFGPLRRPDRSANLLRIECRSTRWDAGPRKNSRRGCSLYWTFITSQRTSCTIARAQSRCKRMMHWYVCVATFCSQLWPGPMTSDHKKSIWPWISALLIGLPLLYVASFRAGVLVARMEAHPENRRFHPRISRSLWVSGARRICRSIVAICHRRKVPSRISVHRRRWPCSLGRRFARAARDDHPQTPLRSVLGDRGGGLPAADLRPELRAGVLDQQPDLTAVRWE